MSINKDLTERFFRLLGLPKLTWKFVDEVAFKNANILRPIKGIAFEYLIRKSIEEKVPGIPIFDGEGDSDVDLKVNGYRIQFKTPVTQSLNHKPTFAVNMHKTHGNEKRPFNLYDMRNKTFDVLSVMHPSDGVLIVPFECLPESKKWKGYIEDPIYFDLSSSWKNRWDLVGLSHLKGKSIEKRVPPKNSELPMLSNETYLSDQELIELLCRPENFRASVMGLKGNLKEYLFKKYLKRMGYFYREPEGTYEKYDLLLLNKEGKEMRVQVKGTSSNMCDPDAEKIGAEAMGTHGQFPSRGYRKSSFDYLAIVVSRDELNSTYLIKEGIHFVFISSKDLPLHYLIGNGGNSMVGYANSRWNDTQFNDVIYPNIKLKTLFDTYEKKVEVKYDLGAYGRYRGREILPEEFRKASHQFTLDEIPDEFEPKNSQLF